MQKGYGQNDLMLDPSSVAMPTHQMMSSGVGSRPVQVISPNADYYQDQRVSGVSVLMSWSIWSDPFGQVYL